MPIDVKVIKRTPKITKNRIFIREYIELIQKPADITADVFLNTEIFGGKA